MGFVYVSLMGYAKMFIKRLVYICFFMVRNILYVFLKKNLYKGHNIYFISGDFNRSDVPS